MSNRAIITNVNWISKIKPEGSIKVGCKFRYRQQDNPVSLKFIDDNVVELIFDQPIKAVTPGQAAVFYLDDVCLGGGIIDRIFVGEREILTTSYEV